MKAKLYNLPEIDLYINNLIKSYLSLNKQLQAGDILIIEEINKIHVKGEQMMKNIDKLMNENGLDDRVRYVYAMRNKLSKFLYKIKENSLICQVQKLKDGLVHEGGASRDDQNQMKRTKQKQQINESLGRSGRSDMKRLSPMKMGTGDQIKKGHIVNSYHKTKYSEAKSFKSGSKSARNKDNNNHNQNSYAKSPNPKPIRTSKKVESSFIPRKQQTHNLNQTFISSSTPNKNPTKPTTPPHHQLPQFSNSSSSIMMKNLSNLIFTIKMTKQEYNEFMRIKKQEEQNKNVLLHQQISLSSSSKKQQSYF